MNYLNCHLDVLLAAAREASMHYAATAPVLSIWGPTTDTTDAIAQALRSRCNEVMAHLRSQHAVTVDANDPDAPIGDMPLSVLRALVSGWFFDTFETIQGELAWERQIAGRDDPPSLPHPARRIVRL